MQAVRNLVFLGRCLGANESMSLDPSSELSDISSTKGSSADDTQKLSGDSAIQDLFARLCTILRREVGPAKKESLVPKSAALQLVAALCSHLPPSSLRPSLSSILLALRHLTDESIPTPYSTDSDFSASLKALRSAAHEIIALLQERLGTTELVAQHAQVEKSVRDKREDRRRKRRIEVVTDPDKAQRKKQRKEDRKKIKRKEKSADERGKRRGW